MRAAAHGIYTANGPNIRSAAALEDAVHELPHSSFGSPAPDQPERPFLMDDINACPQPGKVLAEIGRVVAVCLGLGVLAHIVVSILGD